MSASGGQVPEASPAAEQGAASEAQPVDESPLADRPEFATDDDPTAPTEGKSAPARAHPGSFWSTTTATRRGAPSCFCDTRGTRWRWRGEGQEALGKALRQLPDLVILDVGLPHLDGYAVARELRRQTNIPLVALTGYGPSESTSLLFDAYLVKPVDPEELVRVLAQRRA